MDRPDVEHDGKHAWYQYAVLLENENDKLLRAAKNSRVAVSLARDLIHEKLKTLNAAIDYLNQVSPDEETGNLLKGMKILNNLSDFWTSFTEGKYEPPTDKVGLSDK